jgi:hypothetical protein
VHGGRAEATAATLARLEAENATLRQRVAKLERLVERLDGVPSWIRTRDLRIRSLKSRTTRPKSIR